MRTPKWLCGCVCVYARVLGGVWGRGRRGERKQANKKVEARVGDARRKGGVAARAHMATLSSPPSALVSVSWMYAYRVLPFSVAG